MVYTANCMFLVLSLDIAKLPSVITPGVAVTVRPVSVLLSSTGLANYPVPKKV
jgi:hypothetical protein